MMKKSTLLATGSLSFLLLSSAYAMETMILQPQQESADFVKEEAISSSKLLSVLLNRTEEIFLDNQEIIIETTSEKKKMSLIDALKYKHKDKYNGNYDDRVKKARTLRTTTPSKKKNRGGKSKRSPYSSLQINTSSHYQI